jgi:hypothetical protein
MALKEESFLKREHVNLRGFNDKAGEIRGIRNGVSEAAEIKLAPKRKTGRPSKRTPRMAKRIGAAIRRGLALTHACQVSGLAFSSFCSWRNDSAQFRKMVEDSIAERCEALLGIMEEAAKKDWRAAQALLQMSAGAEHYNPKNRVEHQHLHFNAEKVLIYLPQKQKAHVEQIEGG